jgi:hypothetical protein
MFGMFVLIVVILQIGYFIKLTYIDGKIMASGSVDAAKISVRAAESNNPSLCRQIKLSLGSTYGSESDLINECFYRIAVYSANRNVCDSISNLSYKEHCYSESISNRSPILCQKFQYSGENDKWLACMNELNNRN